MEAFSSIQLNQYIDSFLVGEHITIFPPEKCLSWALTPVSEILERLSKSSVIFIHLKYFQEWSNFLLYCANQREILFPLKVILIFYSDILVKQDDILLLKTVYPSVSFWIQNLCFDLSNVNLLPLGINNGLFGELTKQILNKTEIQKQYNVVITRFVVNSKDRIEFVDFLNHHPELLPYCVSKTLAQDIYYQLMNQHFFSVCPCGNGYDTFRFWESLISYSIPIVKRNPFFEKLQREFPNIPMIVLESWEDLPNLISSLTPELYSTLWTEPYYPFLLKDYWSSKLSALVNTP